MNETATADFFDRLERELYEAASRRGPGWGGPARSLAVALATVAALALALVPILAVLGGGDPPDRSDRTVPGQGRVGTIIERAGERHRIVAVGGTAGAGPWQLETYRSSRLADPDSGEVYQPAGLRCLGIYLAQGGGSGQCGEFPRTPGFSRSQHTVDRDGAATQILVYGRVPERAARVIVQRPGHARIRTRPLEGPPGARGDFYLVALPPDAKGRVNWTDRRGREGSRGIELLPP